MLLSRLSDKGFLEILSGRFDHHIFRKTDCLHHYRMLIIQPCLDIFGINDMEPATYRIPLVNY